MGVYFCRLKVASLSEAKAKGQTGVGAPAETARAAIMAADKTEQQTPDQEERFATSMTVLIWKST